MPRWLHAVTTAIHRVAFTGRLRKACAHATDASTPGEQALYAALAATCSDAEAPDWTSWSARIERVRHALQRSPAQVTFDDFGAGTRRTGAPPRRVTRDVRAVVRGSVPVHEARLLYHLVRQAQPQVCLELGTCLGISAAYLAAALRENGGGRLLTLEGGAALARLARRHLDALDLSDHVQVMTGRFQDVLPGLLARHTPIDFAFIDGHHDPEATLAYFEQIAPHLSDGALLVFDDVAWSFGMRRAWHTLTSDARLPTTVDLLPVGIGLYASVASR